MKLTLVRALGLLSLSLILAGCHSTVDGRMRAGVPFAKDQFTSRYEVPVAKAFQAAKDVLAFNGTLVAENTINNSLEARVDTRRLWVKIDEIDPNLAQVVVQARKKNGVSDVDLASEVSKQIALKLATMR